MTGSAGSTKVDPGLLKSIYQTKWGIARLSMALALLSVLVVDNPARLARLRWAALPGFDYKAETIRLREQGRFGEALVVADAGRQVLDGDQVEELERERHKTIEQRDSYWRRGTEFLRGAITGQGTSVESLVGAIATDMLIVGDIRDLLIQAAKQGVDGESDKLVIVLSTIGVVTTVAPEFDWAAALLKIAKKSGYLSAKMVESIIAVCRRASTGSFDELKDMTSDVTTLSRKASPSGALRLISFADDPSDLAKITRFVEDIPDGAFVLHVTGKEGAKYLLKDSGRAIESGLQLAARKGNAGVAWLRTGALALLRPHPLTGLFKGVYKGNVPAAVRQLLIRADAYGSYVLTATAVWLLVETLLIYRGIAAVIANCRRA